MAILNRTDLKNLTKSDQAPSLLTSLGAFAFGIGTMYIMDNHSGRRRRALIRDQALHLGHVASNRMEVGFRDLSNRSYGMLARSKRKLMPEQVDDDILVARVASQLGRAVSHPHAIQLTAEDGIVTLRGPILKSEYEAVLERIRKVPGVKDVMDQLEQHERPGHIPDLQGTPRKSKKTSALKRYWTPATQFVVGSLTSGLLAYGIKSAVKSKLEA